MIDTKYAAYFIQEQTALCLLCKNTPCSRACPDGIKCGDIIRSLRFDNTAGARSKVLENTACAACTSVSCMNNCTKKKISHPVPIQEIICTLQQMDKTDTALQYFSGTECSSQTLEVTFCGVRCENPFFLSSSVVASNYEMIAKSFDEGWAGVAFKTIGIDACKEVSPRFSTLRKESNTFVGFKNIEQISDHTEEENLECIRRLKKNYPSKVIIASIMGRTVQEWEKLARNVEDAGADIIECNFSCPNMAAKGLGSDIGQSPELVAEYVRAVKKSCSIPVLAKMTPNIGNMEIPALAAVKAGADGISAINTIKSVMNIDLQSFVSGPAVSGYTSVGGYSGKAVKPIALRFISDMKHCPELRDIPISGMGGIETWQDAAEFLALGCATVQVTTAVMQYGFRIISDMTDGLKRYLAKGNYSSVSEIIGKGLEKIVPTDKLDRDTKCYPKIIHDKCVSCGRCVISCSDGGHQALSIGDKTDSYPVMDPKKCVGCQLCILVCPTGAVVPGTRVHT